MRCYNLLARVRRFYGLSQREVAAAIGVSRQLLMFWETGRWTPKAGQVVAWLHALAALATLNQTGGGE